MRRKTTLALVLITLGLALLACSIDFGDVPTPVPPTETQPGDSPDDPTFTPPSPDDPPTHTPSPPTFTPIPPTATWTIHPTITSTFTSEPCVSDSEYVSDITISDGELFAPGESFTKTWRIRNDGTCTWTTDYEWVQVDSSGGMLTTSPDVKNLTTSVAPDGTLDISVSLTLSAGASAGTLYEARFQMRDPAGDLFGTHPFTLIYASAGEGICPIPTAGTLPYLNASEGYCFLYPDTFTISTTAFGVGVTGPHPGGSGEVILPNVHISYEGAGGQNTVQFSNAKIAAWQAPGYPPTTGNTNLDGENAVWAEGLPGIAGSRITFVVYNNRGYIMTLMPVDGSFPTATADAMSMWVVVSNSFRWIDP